MSENIRSELFFLKQFGFNDILLEHVFFLGVDPIQVIFDSKHLLHWELENIFTDKEKKLSKKFNEYKNFKIDLFKNEEIIKKNERNKIYFKYDCNNITKLIPKKIMPLFMYSKGNISLLKSNKERVAIVGTRSTTKESIQITKRLTIQLSRSNITIVRWLAEGVDTVTHKTSVDNNANTTAILPSTSKTIYPKKNKEGANNILTQ